jgi:hypothetical protein
MGLAVVRAVLPGQIPIRGETRGHPNATGAILAGAKAGAARHVTVADPVPTGPGAAAVAAALAARAPRAAMDLASGSPAGTGTASRGPRQGWR